MKKQVIRIAVVGAGWVAKEHLKVLAAREDFQVVGLTSRTASKAKELLSEFNLSCFYQDLTAMMSQAKPDALMICVTEESMFDVVAQAMSFGIPLFIEKPAGMTAALNLKLSQMAADKGIKTMVGYNRRYYSIFRKGLGLIKEKGPLLGIAVEGHERIWRVLETNRFSKEVLNNWIYANSTHTIDLLRFFAGDVDDVKIFGQAVHEPQGDQFAAVFKFTNGALGTYQSHWHSPGGWRVTLFGDGITVEFKPLESGRWMGKDFVSHDIVPDEIDVKFKPGFYQQLSAFADLVHGQKLGWPSLDLAGAYQTMAIAEKMLTTIKP